MAFGMLFLIKVRRYIERTNVKVRTYKRRYGTNIGLLQTLTVQGTYLITGYIITWYMIDYGDQFGEFSEYQEYGEWWNSGVWYRSFSSLGVACRYILGLCMLIVGDD